MLPAGGHLSKGDEALARICAPILWLDEREPFRPQVAGVTVARTSMPSASFSRDLAPPDGGFIIEYALWWDWDINHLYELEHIWVSGTNSDGGPLVTIVEGSSHGSYRILDTECRGTHPVVYCEPGKHAFFIPESVASLNPPILTLLCHDWAGCGGLIGRTVAPGSIPLRYDPANRRIARRWLQRFAFTPSFQFTREVTMETLPLHTWQSVAAWIPDRMRALLETAEQMPVPKPLNATTASSLEDLPPGYGARYALVLVAEPPPVAAKAEADRLEWASAQIRTARRRGIRLMLQMTGSVPPPLVPRLRQIISRSDLPQSTVLLLPASTSPIPVEADSDLALGYVLDHAELDIETLRRAVLAGVEYAFAPAGYVAVPPKVRKACGELGLSWIVLSHDDSEITQRETTAILLDRRG
jgi:hypothetical protein